MATHQQQFFAALHELDEAFTRTVRATLRQLEQAVLDRYPVRGGRELNDVEQIRPQRAAERCALRIAGEIEMGSEVVGGAA
jgi:hypothetical protein